MAIAQTESLLVEGLFSRCSGFLTLAATVRRQEHANVTSPSRLAQRGMDSRFAPRGRFAPAVSVLVSLNEWLVRKYAAASEVVTA